MSIVNIAYTPVLTWANPNMKQLERQVLVPMFGEHPVELGLSGKEAEVLARLKAEPRYQKLFPDAFAGQFDPFTVDNVTKAIAAFERILISGNSSYDRYLNGEKTVISASAKSGVYKGVGSTNPNKSSFVKGFVLTPQERRDVIAFLKSLTDEKFLTDKRFRDLWKESPGERRRQ